MGVSVPDTSVSGPGRFRCLIETLKFFADSRRLGVVDRIGFAMAPEAVKEAVYEALRTIAALQPRAPTLEIGVETREGTRVYTARCCDYFEVRAPGECGGIYGVVKRVLHGDPGLVGKAICCVPCPSCTPGREELEELFRLLDTEPVKGLDLAKEIASEAFAWRRGGEQ